MDGVESLLDEPEFDDGLEECLSRDVSKLREALASDNGLSDEFSDYLGEGKPLVTRGSRSRVCVGY